MGRVKGVKRKGATNDTGLDHLRATRLRSRPSSGSTSIGSPDGKTTEGALVLFAALILLVLLVRRLEDGVWDGMVGGADVGESIIIMTACLRLAPAERGST